MAIIPFNGSLLIQTQTVVFSYLSNLKNLTWRTWDSQWTTATWVLQESGIVVYSFPRSDVRVLPHWKEDVANQRSLLPARAPWHPNRVKLLQWHLDSDRRKRNNCCKKWRDRSRHGNAGCYADCCCSAGKQLPCGIYSARYCFQLWRLRRANTTADAPTTE